MILIRKYIYIITIFLAVFIVISGFLSIEARSELIVKTIQNDITVHKFISISLFFLAFQIFLILSYLLKEITIASCRRSAFKYLWSLSSPKTVFDVKRIGIDKIVHALFENCSEYVSTKIELVSSIITTVSIFIIFTYKIFIDKFWYATLILPMAIIMSISSQQVFSNRFKINKRLLNKTRVSLIEWLRGYYESFPETFFNWNFNVRRQHFHSCFLKALRQFDMCHKNLQYILFLRKICVITLNDIPFLGGVLLIIYCILTKKVTPINGIIWIGLLDYIIMSSNSLNSIYELHLTSKNSIKYIQTIFSYHVEEKDDFNFHIIDNDSSKKFDFILLNKQIISISTENGVHKIKAKNGSGKSSLLQVLIGQNNEFYDWPKNQIMSLRKKYKSHIRVIEKNPILIRIDYGNIFENIFGPTDIVENEKLWKKLEDKLVSLFSSKIGNVWIKHLNEVKNKYSTVFDEKGLPILSSGEHVLISFFRAIVYWDEDVYLLVIDEADSLFDEEKKWLFNESINFLSKKIVVWKISHEAEEDCFAV